MISTSRTSTLVPPSPPPSKLHNDASTIMTAAPMTTKDSRRQPKKKSRSLIGIGLLVILRAIFLDLPLLVIFTGYTSLYLLEQVHREYLVPLKRAMQWNEARADTEITSYHYVCTEDDITADSVDELIAQPKWTPEEIVEHQQIHGATILPNILSNATATAVRDFIVRENQRQEGFWVINPKNRYSFGIQVDQHPSIPIALREIATHPILKPVLTQLVGRNPAIIEFTAITSTYGAGMQNFHQDVVPEGSAAKYARTFIPSYSLFIPLQDTTQPMGATQICPGTQMCGDAGAVEDVCEDYAVSAAGGTQQVWPLGWGALMNQQTTHRGTAYTDPHTNGMPRVLFILTFAPRPQYALPGVVESRMIGQGGSYSIHWQNWGHTLQDYANAPTAMAQPWRTLRALGLYNNNNNDWGWDMITVATMRIANGDNGYTRDTLENFVWEQGGFKWLPTWLQGTVEEYDEEEEEEGEEPWDPDGGWHYFLLATFQKVKQFAAKAHQVALGVVVVGLVVVSTGVAIAQRDAQVGVEVLVRNLVRLLILHGMILALAGCYWTSLSQTNWARQVKSGKLFQPYSDPEIHFVAPASEDSPAPYTLPNQRDVLVAPQYDAWYLASYANILEYNQPGNRRWKQLMNDHASGFAGLSPALQNHLCDFLVFDTMLQTHKGRLLLQMEAGRWTDLLDDEAIAFCKQELLRRQNPLTRTLMRQVDLLKGETKFGAWRHTTMQQSTMANHLNAWTNRILRGTPRPMPPELDGANQVASSVLSKGVRKPLVVPTTGPKRTEIRPSKIPSSPPAMNEPYRGAWLTTGDTVEGQYQGEHNEYYKGVLMDTCVDRDSYDVVYVDGEEDLGLCRSCVRPFKPYKLNEVVDVRVDEFTFFKAKIVKVHPGGKEDRYRIRYLDDDGSMEKELYEVQSKDLRRFQ